MPYQKFKGEGRIRKPTPIKELYTQTVYRQYMVVFKKHRLYLKYLCFKICLIVFRFMWTNVCSVCSSEDLTPPPLPGKWKWNCVLQSTFRISEERQQKQRTCHALLASFYGIFVTTSGHLFVSDSRVIHIIIKNRFWGNACSHLAASATVKAFVFTAISV